MCFLKWTERLSNYAEYSYSIANFSWKSPGVSQFWRHRAIRFGGGFSVLRCLAWKLDCRMFRGKYFMRCIWSFVALLWLNRWCSLTECIAYPEASDRMILAFVILVSIFSVIGTSGPKRSLSFSVCVEENLADWFAFIFLGFAFVLLVSVCFFLMRTIVLRMRKI